ncbi:MAG TPA: glycosyltransferase [Lentimicrobium sp.]|nr:glycosyltransferase [Lentimicrobium sp.]
MKLSIVIVNYNVRYFLEQCLHSVEEAISGIEAEVFVVDNNSVDGSNEMVSSKFPWVKLIANKENLGFSKANNQAISLANGEYILVLNPDTVLEHDTLHQCIRFMDNHPDAGGLGIKMVDGKGKFLPESKRGLPTPLVAFYKIFGLSALFPKSRTFGKYHLGYLDNNKTHVVEILAGAFMMLRKVALDKVGLLDETFFMYGEDIDLSYRLIKGGYKNYYYPEARIIHYKGESTKKSSINYVFVFYNAMVIFAKKHFSQKNARIFSLLIHTAIYLRAGLAIMTRLFRTLIMPLIDALVIYLGSLLIVDYWESNVIYKIGGHYPQTFLTIVLPVYVLIWLFSVYVVGGYDKPVKIRKIIAGIFSGTVAILVFYALLPSELRFSRAIIILSGIWALVSTIGIRLILHFAGFRDYKLGYNINKRFAIIGDTEEAKRVADLLHKTLINPSFIGLVSTGNKNTGGDGFIGTLNQLAEIIGIYKIDEIIFCARDIPAQNIIDTMTRLQGSEVDFKIAPPESLSIIGSNSINTTGDLYVIDINSVGKANNRRNKRLFDIMVSLMFLPVSPLAMWIARNPLGFIFNIFRVLTGFRTWVGYKEGNNGSLPYIKKGILDPTDGFPGKALNEETATRLNMLYARDYKMGSDLNIIWRGFRNLGRLL